MNLFNKATSYWCECCSIRCVNAYDMAGHLHGKKYSLLNKVWRSIKAVRMKNKSKQGSAAGCDGKVNEDGSFGIPRGR